VVIELDAIIDACQTAKRQLKKAIKNKT